MHKPKNSLSHVLARFALGIWCIISVDLVLDSHCSLRLVLLRSTENWFLREMSISVVQCLVRQWIHVLRQYFGGYGRTSHIFYVAADSNPEVLLSLLLQNGDACPVDASGCSFALRSSQLENWGTFPSFMWLRRGITDSFFWGTCVRHRCRGAGSTRESDFGLAGKHAN